MNPYRAQGLVPLRVPGLLLPEQVRDKFRKGDSQIPALSGDDIHSPGARGFGFKGHLDSCLRRNDIRKARAPCPYRNIDVLPAATG